MLKCMRVLESVRRNLKKTFAIVERNILFELRFKAKFLQGYISPIANFIIFFIIFGTIFNVNKDYRFGYWNSWNYVLFLLIGYNIQQTKTIILRYDQLFMREKFWKTLQGLLVAPFNKLDLLIGIVFSDLILASIPIITMFIIAFFIYPITLLSLFLFLVVFFSVAIFFGSIGIFIGIFSISNESIAKFLMFSMNIILAFACINYPLEIFPEIIQIVILLNPLFYFFDLLRLIWYAGIDLSTALTYISPFHIIIVIIFTIIGPIISIFLFNKIYKKLGITGY